MSGYYYSSLVYLDLTKKRHRTKKYIKRMIQMTAKTFWK